MRPSVLRVPKTLAVVTIAVGLACAEAVKPSDDTTSASNATEDGMVPQCPAEADEQACVAVAGCVWEPDDGCVVDCEQLGDQTSCEMLGYCLWVPPEEACFTVIA